jgi:phosphatidylserine synthase
MLTDDYFIWLPIPVTASIVAIVAYTLMVIYDRYWFRTTAQIIVISIGIAVVGSLLHIFPFDFSVMPNATAVEVVPIVVTGFLILMAVIYGISALVLFVRLIRSYAVK